MTWSYIKQCGGKPFCRFSLQLWLLLFARCQQLCRFCHIKVSINAGDTLQSTEPGGWAHGGIYSPQSLRLRKLQFLQCPAEAPAVSQSPQTHLFKSSLLLQRFIKPLTWTHLPCLSPGSYSRAPPNSFFFTSFNRSVKTAFSYSALCCELQLEDRLCGLSSSWWGITGVGTSSFLCSSLRRSRCLAYSTVLLAHNDAEFIKNEEAMQLNAGGQTCLWVMLPLAFKALFWTLMGLKVKAAALMSSC